MPVAMKRRVLMEVGHRCAIPTCRTVPVELALTVPYADVKKHTFENLIALCPTCHTRCDRGDIDRLSMHGARRTWRWSHGHSRCQRHTPAHTKTPSQRKR